MDRRDILRYTALATGAAIVIPATTFITGCKTEILPTTPLSFFTLEEMKLAKEIVDTILPKSDSPSASEVGVHLMIDQMVGKSYDEGSRSEYRMSFDSIKAYLDKERFSEVDDKQKLSILNRLNTGEVQDKALAEAFLELRQQTIACYLSTEEIGTKYLNYLPVPGEYEGCIDLASVDNKAWAL